MKTESLTPWFEKISFSNKEYKTWEESYVTGKELTFPSASWISTSMDTIKSSSRTPEGEELRVQAKLSTSRRRGIKGLFTG